MTHSEWLQANPLIVFALFLAITILLPVVIVGLICLEDRYPMATPITVYILFAVCISIGFTGMLCGL